MVYLSDSFLFFLWAHSEYFSVHELLLELLNVQLLAVVHNKFVNTLATTFL